MNSPINYFLLLVRRKPTHGQTSLSRTLTAAGFPVIAAIGIIHHPAVSKPLHIRKEVCNQSKRLRICGLSPKSFTFSAISNTYIDQYNKYPAFSSACIMKLSGYLHIIP